MLQVAAIADQIIPFLSQKDCCKVFKDSLSMRFSYADIMVWAWSRSIT